MKAIVSVLFCAAVCVSLAQTNLKFDIVDYDFGEIKEEDGYAEYTFSFVNTADQPIRITNVKASCGCTTPGWTKEEVMPGDSGFVMARYNPRNRPGRFRKSLRVTTSDRTSDQTLYIMGFVQPRPKSPEEAFPVVFGDLRLKKKALNIGKITNEKSVNRSFDLYNSSDSVASLDPQAIDAPPYITVTMEPSQLSAKSNGKLVLTYDPKAKNDYGFVNDNIRLDSAGTTSVSVMAIIEEYFPEMTAEELDQAPKLELSTATFDFGSVQAGTVLETTFQLNNVGKEKLALRAIKSNCSCVTYDIKKKDIKKGKSQTLDVRFDTSEMRGNQFKSITIYSNDPIRPTQLINIRGKVEK